MAYKKKRTVKSSHCWIFLDGVRNHKQTRKRCVGHRPVWASQRHPLLVFIVELLRSSGSDSRRITHFSMAISRIWNKPIDKRYYMPQATKWNKRVHLGSRHQKAIYSGDPIFPHVLWYITWFYILLLYNEYLRQSSPHPGRARRWNVPTKTRTRTCGHTCACASARTRNK